MGKTGALLQQHTHAYLEDGAHLGMLGFEFSEVGLVLFKHSLGKGGLQRAHATKLGPLCGSVAHFIPQGSDGVAHVLDDGGELGRHLQLELLQLRLALVVVTGEPWRKTR